MTNDNLSVDQINAISGQILDAAIKVHIALGPGLLESAYEACHELRTRSLSVESQVALPVCYDGIRLDVGYRLDLVVENAVIVEIKAIEKLAPIHEAQLLSYLKLSGRLGILINFHVEKLIEGFKRRANNLYDSPPPPPKQTLND